MISTRAVIRESLPGDRLAIRRVEELAFGRPGEANLSEQLIGAAVDTLSLVAEVDAGIVGHVLLSRIEGPDRALALAPLAIEPDFQEMQIGTQLVRQALDLARERGWRAVFVLGHPDYYCRFGFKSKLADGAQTEWQGSRFLALELVDGALAGWTGPLHYPEPFSNLS